ncbi:truncated FRIGIDA-like protein 1 [Olea europaea var. sylvestris]|uniref:FRIGIDA-like protein n=1 Tax=Olea europaea subsp. europaea TaxID=158383 RepID=A0A8S0T8Z9_OLEEU|nr:truncated FRIGIDA-like protein 1 [Olea europaea var. sylvestris]CAA3001538.1 Hypothetical predicted protein [Olea europaea subsp. europaea]
MALTTVKSIETALGLVDSKKENLKKAFEDLQSHSSALSSFNFTWSDLDSYFTSIQSDLLEKFSTIQTLELSQSQTQKLKRKKLKDSLSADPIPARAELKLLCEKMDGMGLRKYIIERPRERTAIRVELPDAWKSAADPGSMILDALEGFCDGGSVSTSDVGGLRRVCVVLLEELMRANVEIGAEVKERARAMAADWKVKIEANSGDGEERDEEETGLVKLGYLQLLATYGLVSAGGYDVNELIDYAVVIARYRQVVDLCQALGLGNRISDVIQKLISKGKQLLALKFIFEFELTDEFPPVPLLKAYVIDSKENVQKIRKSGKSSRQSLNEAVMKEISALKSVIKCIDDHGLESQYPKHILVTRIEKLEKEKADKKRPATATVPKPPQQAKQQKQRGNKRVKEFTGPLAVKNKNRSKPVVFPSQPSHVQTVGLLPDNAALYSSSPAYGRAGPHVAADMYAGSSAGLHGFPGAPMGFSGNVNQTVTNAYPSERQGQPSYYDAAIGYGGYVIPPQYHPGYYPQ